MLSFHLEMPGSEIPLTLNKSRPVVDLPADRIDQCPQFNLSHSGSVVALAWSTRFPLGVDVESEKNFDNMEGVARRVMNDDEYPVYEAFDKPGKIDAFYQMWVRKEAILKQMTTGFEIEPDLITVPMDNISTINGEQRCKGWFENREFHLILGRVADTLPTIFWALSTDVKLESDQLNIRYVNALG